MAEKHHEWRHGWRPLTAAAALVKAKGNRRLAAKLLRKPTGKEMAESAARKAKRDRAARERRASQGRPYGVIFTYRDRNGPAGGSAQFDTAAERAAFMAEKRKQPGTKGWAFETRDRAKTSTSTRAKRAPAKPAAERVRVVELLASGQMRVVERPASKAPSAAERRYLADRKSRGMAPPPKRRA